MNESDIYVFTYNLDISPNKTNPYSLYDSDLR